MSRGEDISVRRAEEQDFEVVRDLLRDGDRFHLGIGVFGARQCPADYARENFAITLASKKDAILLAFCGPVPRDFVRMSGIDAPEGRFHGARTYAEIHEIVVAESARRSGIGRMLMEAAVAWARDRNMPSLELNCFGENASARKFYLRLGLSEARVRYRLDLNRVMETPNEYHNRRRRRRHVEDPKQRQLGLLRPRSEGAGVMAFRSQRLADDGYVKDGLTR